MAKHNLDPRQPWSQRADETSRSFAAFLAYRDLGPSRTLANVCDSGPPAGANKVEGGRSVGAVRTWSARYDWGDRARAYDDWLDRESVKDQVQQVKDMRRRHAIFGQLAVQKAGERLREIEGTRLTIREAAILLELGVKIERLARGEVTERIGIEGAGPSGAQLLAILRSNPELVGAADELSAALNTTATDMVQHQALRRVDAAPSN